MAYGDIGTVIATLDFHPATTYFIDLVHVSGNVWLICYQGGGDNTQVRTVEILPDGTMPTGVLDIWNIRPTAGQWPRILHVSGSIYAIFDKTAGGVPTLTTFAVLDNGTFVEPIKDDWNWPDHSFDHHAVVKRTAIFQTVACMSDFNHGWLYTLEIDSAGIITELVTDDVEFDGVYGSPFDALERSSGVYAMVYRATGDTLAVTTFTVDVFGQIAYSAANKRTFAAATSDAPSICRAGGDIYALGMVRTGGKPWLSTISISASGAVGASVLANHKVLDFACGIPNLFQISPGIVAYALAGAGHDGFIYTFTIDTTTGAITATPISSCEFDESNCDWPRIFHLGGDYYGIAHLGAGNHGIITTLTVSTPEAGADHSLMMGIGP